MSPEQASKQLRMLRDFARFYAACWLHPQLVCRICERTSEPPYLTSSPFLSPLCLLDLLPTSSCALRELGELFHPHYPQVLTHGGLCPVNILVSPSTGRVTRIIEWAEAELLPFGLALYGLDVLLGYLGLGGWSYLEIRDELEQKFWKYLSDCIADAKGPPEDRIRNAVTIAREVGVLMQYGFKWKTGVVE
ncbi:hypothetical protein HO173_002260 [Letharia columbiana]|uniref:Aminoglycoside phosphotransferase domain-containing protein n=1 Tax=Letharia columbiana TaxID=112416 RepID=A0A8H6G3I0_9LECA|nr:uncharacterized protein HO173_002260 [Letharia columbiana]KAF6239714.1 hypothetical protein HO173_002260 [Letharia columbiana]